jgi:hypothetical protein
MLFSDSVFNEGQLTQSETVINKSVVTGGLKQRKSIGVAALKSGILK